MFIAVCHILLFLIDFFCNLVYPAYETFFMLAKFRKEVPSSNNKYTHWTTYWIFYSLLYYIQRLLYFFPFSYEIRVIVTLLMAHPKIQAATLIQQFLVTNPLIMIKVSDAQNRLKL